MQIYLVGGAVRDQLLGLPVKDRDWLVVGATPQDLLKQGYTQVGKDFPVFLNPQSKEEYALARTERKAGAGYTGFICDFSPHISLAQDLLRRDLSINAIAQDQQGKLHDPYGGIQDLAQRLLRHISPAFAEDPLRVLRVARFAARYHHLGFRIADETLQLMADINAQGELQQLTTERVWLETEKALLEPNPEIYFETLRQIGALATLMPELNALYGVPNPPQHHPEIDSFIHTMLVLQQTVQLGKNTPFNQVAIRFAALCHDLGKALSPKAQLPHHYGHEQKGLVPTKQLAKRLKVPTYVKELALLCCEYHSHIHKAFELRAETILNLFNRADIWRKPQRFQEMMLVSQADSRGRTGFENRAYPQTDYLWQLYQAAQNVDIQQIIAEGFEKENIRHELNRRRLNTIKQARKQLLEPLMAQI